MRLFQLTGFSIKSPILKLFCFPLLTMPVIPPVDCSSTDLFNVVKDVKQTFWQGKYNLTHSSFHQAALQERNLPF